MFPVENRLGSGYEINIVVIAASLGGVEALSRLLQDLPSDFPVPVLMVQHLSADSPSVLDKVIQARSSVPVKWAEHGQRLLPGTAYLAVPNRHLTVAADGTACLQASNRVNWVRPAADVLFQSVAQRFGASALGVVLTGSLFDGMAGAVQIKRRGGWVLAQDESSSKCFEMPNAAIRSGAVDFVLPLEVLPFAVTALVMGAGATSLFRCPSRLPMYEDLGLVPNHAKFGPFMHF